MVEVGQLVISGSLDTSQMEKGFDKVEKNIKNLSNQNIDLTNIEKNLNDLSNKDISFEMLNRNLENSSNIAGEVGENLKKGLRNVEDLDLNLKSESIDEANKGISRIDDNLGNLSDNLGKFSNKSIQDFGNVDKSVNQLNENFNALNQDLGKDLLTSSLDTNQIEMGLNRIEDGFDDANASADSLGVGMLRLSERGLKLAAIFGSLALAGVGAMAGIASKAPALAGSMAKLKVSFGELTRSLGEALAPAFAIASEAFADFVQWIEDHEDDIRWFTETILQGAIDTVHGLGNAWNWLTETLQDIGAKIGLDLDLGEVLKSIYERFGPEIIAGLLGAWIGGKLGGGWGAIIGGLGAGATTYVARRTENEELYEREKEAGYYGGNIELFGPLGPPNPSMAMFGGGFKVGEWFADLWNSWTRQDTERGDMR